MQRRYQAVNILYWSLSVVVLSGLSGCGNAPAERFSEREAATVMIGTLSGDALIKLGPAQTAAAKQPGDIKAASEYLETAGFSQTAGEPLLRMLTKPPTGGTTDDRVALWNAVNGGLSDEAKRLHPERGASWMSFGISLQFMHASLKLSGGSLANTPQGEKTTLLVARTVFASPVGSALFPTGRELPLPDKMKQHLDAAEATDTSSLDSCRDGAEHLRLLLQMAKAVAHDGPSALDRFPD